MDFLLTKFHKCDHILPTRLQTLKLWNLRKILPLKKCIVLCQKCGDKCIRLSMRWICVKTCLAKCFTLMLTFKLYRLILKLCPQNWPHHATHWTWLPKHWFHLLFELLLLCLWCSNLNWLFGSWATNNNCLRRTINTLYTVKTCSSSQDYNILICICDAHKHLQHKILWITTHEGPFSSQQWIYS